MNVTGRDVVRDVSMKRLPLSQYCEVNPVPQYRRINSIMWPVRVSSFHVLGVLWLARSRNSVLFTFFPGKSWRL